MVWVWFNNDGDGEVDLFCVFNRVKRFYVKCVIWFFFKFWGIGKVFRIRFETEK